MSKDKKLQCTAKISSSRQAPTTASLKRRERSLLGPSVTLLSSTESGTKQWDCSTTATLAGTCRQRVISSCYALKRLRSCSSLTRVWDKVLRLRLRVLILSQLCCRPQQCCSYSFESSCYMAALSCLRLSVPSCAYSPVILCSRMMTASLMVRLTLLTLTSPLLLGSDSSQNYSSMVRWKGRLKWRWACLSKMPVSWGRVRRDCGGREQQSNMASACAQTGSIQRIGALRFIITCYLIQCHLNFNLGSVRLFVQLWGLALLKNLNKTRMMDGIKHSGLHIVIVHQMNEANETIFANLAGAFRAEIEKVVSVQLEHTPYDSLKSEEQIAAISQQVIERASGLNRNFKYIVQVALVAKGGNGFDVGGLALYNPDMDGSLSMKWESNHLTCIVTLYGIAN